MEEKNEYLKIAFKNLNDVIQGFDNSNEIIVLDFSHFSPVKEGNSSTYDIYFKSIGSTEEYKEKYFNYISNLVNNTSSNWKKYAIGKQKLLYNFDNHYSEGTESTKSVFLNDELDKSNVPVHDDFDAKKHLITGFPEASLLPGKCFIIYAEEHGGAQSIVYVLLKEKINGVASTSEEPYDLLSKLPENLRNFDAELYSLIIHEMVSSLVEEKASLYQQVQDLNTKALFSLTTHSLKTHLSTTVIKTKNAFKSKLKSYIELSKDFEEHDRELNILYSYTNFLSLLDKLDNKDAFCEVATRGNDDEPPLFQTQSTLYDINAQVNLFNSHKSAGNPKIIITYIGELVFPITIYSLHFSKTTLDLFFNMIFENAFLHGDMEGKDENDRRIIKKITVECNSNYMIFKNKTVNENTLVDENKLTGNLALFKKLIEETNSGTVEIEGKEHQFTVKISMK